MPYHKKKSKTDLRKGAHTKYNPNITPLVIEGLVRRGLNFREIAKRLDVSEQTLIKWRREIPEVREIFEQTKDYKVRAFELEESLFKSAKGYEYTEKIEEMYFEPTGEVGKDGKPVMRLKFVKQRTIKKHMPPNVNAIRILLAKFAPEDWGDLKDMPLQVATQVNVDMPKVVIGKPVEEVKNKKVIKIIKPKKDENDK